MTNVTPRLSASLRISRVERRRRDRIEARRRLVEEQDRRIERHRARDAGALLHAAGELGGQMAGERLEPDQRQLHPRDEVDRVVGQVRVHLERQAARSRAASSSRTARPTGT